jgi:hypothetical protein
MKRPLLASCVLILALVAMVALPTGCASTNKTQHTESTLAASGFKVMPATTPQQLQLLQQLPTGKLSKVNRRGQQYYVFPDAAQKLLYVGQQKEFQDYQSMIEIQRAAAADNAAAHESLVEAQVQDAPEWDGAWGNWTW